MPKNFVRAWAFAALTGFATVSASPGSPKAETAAPTVTIDSGQIEGVVAGDVLSFKGIPYAAAPLGDLRWREPQPARPWPGLRKAAAYGRDCVQKAIPGDAAASGGVFGEDCLVLNVWRPAANRPGEKLPVMVWIHGGGFLNGGSSEAMFDGSAFARRGLVLVSFNYRLGRLAFFAHPALSAAKEGRLGNYGLFDRLAALRWVKRNIAAFGGDPDAVTVVGESAGGISIVHMLGWPEARGLFQRAAILSGGGRTYLVALRKLREGTPQLPSAEASGLAFAKSVGIAGTGPDALKALRALPVEKVNGDMSMLALLMKPATYAGGPIFDGDTVAALPEEIMRRGAAAKVALIIGSTGQDLPVTFPPLRQNPLAFFGADAARAQALYMPGGKPPVPALAPVPGLAAAVGVDLTMHEPARFAARQMTAAGNAVWLYRFNYVAEALRAQGKGAEHASELPYLFNSLDVRFGKAVTAKDRATAAAMHAYFANFAKTGDPNGAGLPPWPKYDPARADLMLFTRDRGAVAEPDPWKERLDLVERAVERR